MLEELLKLLGVATVAEAQAAISRFNNMADEILTLVNANTTAEALQQVKQLHGFAASVQAAVGAAGPEALARMEGWKTAHAQLAETQQKLADLTKKGESQQAEALMARATTEMRLTPALKPKAEEFYQKYGIAALQTFLETLPPSSITPPSDPIRQPRQEPSMSGGWSSDDDAYCKATGRSKEQVMASRKLWGETGGVITNAHIVELNRKQQVAAGVG